MKTPIKIAIIAAISLAALLAWYFFLPKSSTDSAQSVTILSVAGTANVERSGDVLAAREGMRLQSLDLLRTEKNSSSWLTLDDYKAVEISELTALRLGREARGFVLTLVYGEIKTRIDQPLYADEDFSIKAGGLALSVRGTVFTANYTDKILKVYVESGVVAVLDKYGNEIAVLRAGESGEYETGEDEDELEALPGAEATAPPTVNYEEGNIVEFGGYEWRVLAVRDGKALLLSEYVLESRNYNDEKTNMTWESCTLRAYLNGAFFDSFSADERAQIADTLNSNKNNQWYYEQNAQKAGAPIGGNDTTDKIFLLSLEEGVQYFGDSGQLANMPSDAPTVIDDAYNELRIARSLSGSVSLWYLRSPGAASERAACVNNSGQIDVFGGDYFLSDKGVRPALWRILP
jgi:hypothetical protein